MEVLSKKRKYIIVSMNIIPCLFFKLLIFFTLIKHYLNVNLYFPRSISLVSGNIFVIHQDGIDVYDPSMKNLVLNVFNFTGNDKIDENNLSKTTILRFDDDDNGIIICLIINKIYIFNPEGTLLYIEQNTIINNKLNSILFTLTPIKRNANYFTYLISFYSELKLSQLFFEYDNNTLTNTLKKEQNYTNPTILGDTYYINENGVTCQLMISRNGDIIICFYTAKRDNHKISYILINPQTYEISPANNIYIDVNNYNYRGMKSITSNDKKKCLICLYFSDRLGCCTIYTIENDSFTELKCYGSICSSKDYCLSLGYIKETNKFFLSCVNYESEIGIVFFDDNFNNHSETQQISISNGYELFSASIIYSAENNDYYIVSDLKYDDINIAFMSLTYPNMSVISYLNDLEAEKNKNKQTTIPTTIVTTIPTTIFTTIPTTTPSPIATTPIPSTIITKTTFSSFNCTLEKCESCDEISFSKKLCTKCNKNKNYYQIEPSLLNNNSYFDCYDNSTKPKNFYFNEITEYYELCYKSCASCEYAGDGNQNNCTECDVDLIFEPEKNTQNCVALCSYFYYYNSHNQYKCTTLPQCPDDFNYLVRVRRKCIDNCEKDKIYKFQYNGECYEKCPEETIQDNITHTCKIKINENCTKSSNKLELYDKGSNEKLIKTYLKEFNDTNKHISLYLNENYSIIIYKDKGCINELQIAMPEIDFGDCYLNVQNDYGLQNTDLIVEIIENRTNPRINPITHYYFFNPVNGSMLDIDRNCKEEIITVKENLKSLLNDSLKSILNLTNQNINVFNKSSEFYTDLCYHYDSPCGKDIALKDRLLIFYPNITLCDSGCTVIGVNLTELTAICECTFKDLANNSNTEDNIYEDAVNKVNDIINQINLVVMGCYKDLFQYDYFHSNIGGVTLLILIGIQMIIYLVYYFSSLFLINKYIFSITDNYILYLNESPLVNIKIISNNNNNEEKNEEKNDEKDKDNPPRKKNYIKDNEINNISETKIMKKKRQSKMLKAREEATHEKLLNSGLKKIKNIKNLSKKLKSKVKNEIILKSNNVHNAPLISSPKEKKKNEFDNYLTTDFNDMNFHDVSVIDKRLFFDYFCDKLKKKQVILELFYINSALKPVTIKLLLLILEIEICFVINAMFINENYISNLYHSKKEENFISFIPRSISRSIYTIFINASVSYFIRCLFIDESIIKTILKREKTDITNMKCQINLVMKEIKIRYNIFILVTSIFSIFSWFYISCFNHIYPHIKIEWIKSSVTIIILIHILTILMVLIETLLRFVSFEIKSEKMYRASIWLG
jgi:hypothetical protein